MVRRRIACVFVLACLGVLSASTVSAQRSMIRGIVRDLAGEPVAGVRVRAESPATERTFETTTNNAGRFSLIGLHRGQWLFTLEKPGYEAAQGFIPVRRTGDSGAVRMTIRRDRQNPSVPTTGRLAGIRGDELMQTVDAAHELFDNGDYDDAISAYESILARVPVLTSLNLQIGHAYREKRDYESARAAYGRVPSGTPAEAEAESALRSLEALTNGRR